ncbi:MAG: SH3 domain-containing protein [Lachnospiraceae bacterium]|nr:SH3 domain-containing protein [Lachnospiraceae bacterium]
MNRFVKKHYHFISFLILAIIFGAWIMLQSYIYPETTLPTSESTETNVSAGTSVTSSESTVSSEISQSDVAESVDSGVTPVLSSVSSSDLSTSDPSLPVSPNITDDQADDNASDSSSPEEDYVSAEAAADTNETTPEPPAPEETVILEEGSYGPGEGKMPFDICIANVRESLNVRSGPGEENEVIAKFLPVDYAHVLERDTEWSHIVSGDVTGYAHNDYLIVGDKAIKKLSDSDKLYVTIDKGTVNIRSEKNTESAALRTAKEGETFKCVPSESDSNWYAVKYDDGNVAYVAVTLAHITVDMDTIDSLTPVG